MTPVLNFTQQNQTACLPNNGRITVNSITEGVQSIPLSNYNITLTNSSGTLIPGSNGVFSALPAGSYSLQAENTTSRCRSSVVQVQILNNTVLPVITNARVPNTNCSPAAANGSLTASATTGGAAAAGGYALT